MTARDALRAMRERAERATPGRWKIWGMSVMADPLGTSNIDDCIDVAHTVMLDEHGKPRTFDAQFIASARTDVPALVAALEAVLDQADRWDRLANLDGTKDVAGWRMQVKAKQVREAIETALGDR